MGTLLFPGYRSERAIVIFMRCEVGTFAAAGRVCSVRTHASTRLTSAARAKQRMLPADGLQKVPGDGGEGRCSRTTFHAEV